MRPLIPNLPVSIPSTAHFIWFGDGLSWLHAMAIRTACLHGGFERVVLHCDRSLEHRAAWRELEGLGGFEVRRIDLTRTLMRCRHLGPRLEAIANRLEKPAARANLLRAALLYRLPGCGRR